MKILLFGKDGQLGWELQRALAPLGEIVALDVDSAPPLSADFSRPESLCGTVRFVAPDLIVNAAAHTAVDRAESEPELARAINATSPSVLAREAAALGAWMVHYSTDYVFDGSGSTPWREDSPTGPLNTYGRTKLEGEAGIRASGCRHVILRTSWLYAARGANFAKTMLRLAQERDTLSVVDDQIGAPTGADLLADVTAHVVRTVRQRPELAGTYHVAARGETSWHGYARQVVGTARRMSAAVRTIDDRIVAVGSDAFPTAARRPRNSRLATERLRHAFALEMPDWRDGVDRMLAEVMGR